MISIDKRYAIALGIIVLMITIMHAKYTIYDGMGEYVIVREGALAVFFACLYFTKRKLKSKCLYLYLVFIAYRLFCSWKVNGGITGEARVVVFVELGLIFVIYMIMNYDNVHVIMRIVRELGSINAVLSVFEYFFKRNIFMKYITVAARMYMKRSMGTPAWRVRTFLIHPIICAVFITATWVVLLYIPYRRKWLNYVIKGCMLLGLIGTKSRSSWIAFLIVNILYLLIKMIKSNTLLTNRNQLYRIILIIVMMLVLAICFEDRVIKMISGVISRWMLSFDWKDSGNYNRVEMIKMGLDRWREATWSVKLFGNGPNYAIELLTSHAIRGWKNAVDNTYLTVLLNYGLIGLVMFVMILCISIYNMFTARNEIVELSALGMISIYSSAFFYDVFSWFSVMAFFCLFLLGQSAQVDMSNDS